MVTAEQLQEDRKNTKRRKGCRTDRVFGQTDTDVCYLCLSALWRMRRPFFSEKTVLSRTFYGSRSAGRTVMLYKTVSWIYDMESETASDLGTVVGVLCGVFVLRVLNCIFCWDGSGFTAFWAGSGRAVTCL